MASGSVSPTCWRRSSDVAVAPWCSDRERDEPGVTAVVAGDDDGLHDVGVAVEHRLDLAELDAVAADLDLVVGAPGELDDAAREDAGDVAGGVHADPCPGGRRTARR